MRRLGFLLCFTFLLGGATNASAACTVDADCDDGLFCNGVERCISIIGTKLCAPGTPPDCDDKVACTLDSCSEAQDRCLNVPADLDGDGHADIGCGGDDCDDGDPNRYPGNVEICDGINHDEDCDPTTFGTKDTDRDSFVDASCCNAQPGGGLACGDDCNDASASVHPNQAEVCNGVDDNCTGGVDEGLRISAYPDVDGDNFGDASAAAATAVCPGTPGFSPLGTDCDDDDVAVHPGSMRCTTGGDIEICGKIGLWQVAVPCPAGQLCVTQPNGTGMCAPRGADVNGDGKVGLAEAIHALGVASGQ